MWPYLSGLGGTVPWLSGTFEVAFGSGELKPRCAAILIATPGHASSPAR